MGRAALVWGRVHLTHTDELFSGREGSRAVCRNAKRMSTRMYIRHISPKRLLEIIPAFVRPVRDVRNFHKQFFSSQKTNKQKKNASLTRWIHNVKRKETSEFDIFIVAHCNKYVKCIIYYTYSMK